MSFFQTKGSRGLLFGGSPRNNRSPKFRGTNVEVLRFVRIGMVLVVFIAVTDGSVKIR
jgi:hypothetical protein